MPQTLSSKTIEQLFEEGTAFLKLNQLKEALAVFEETIRLYPNSSVCYFLKGATLNFLNRPEEALAVFEQAIRLDPNNSVAYNGKGAILSALNRPEEAKLAEKKGRELGFL